MRTYRKARARRTLSRKRTRSRRKYGRKKSGGVATKAYVQKAITRKQESKMCQFSDAFYWNSEQSVYNDVLCYRFAAVGTTDRGRIGNTIWGTKIVLKYKFISEFFSQNPENYEELIPQGVPPITMKCFIVRRKANYALLAEQWFKAKDRGTEFPYLGLTPSNIQNGLNVLNTDVFTVLAMKNITLRPTRDDRNKIATGSLSYTFPKPTKITLNENSTNVVNNDLITPMIEVWMYPYWGTDSEHGSAWGFQYSVQQYYKD